MQLILASFSQARADLLRAAGYEFTQTPSEMPERDRLPNETPADYVRFLAQKKAETVAALYPDAVILGADTVLYINNHTLGKPHDLKDAARMLKEMSGRTHRLCTGICVIAPGSPEPWVEHDIALVTIRTLTDEQIRKHVELAMPLKYAGAYALQREGSVLIERIEGDPNTIIGLPMVKVVELLDRAAQLDRA